jgi:transposase
MTKLNKTLNFAGQKIFVGIDVHKRTWNLTLFCGSMFLRTFSQPPSVDAVKTLLQRDYPGADYLCGYESGYSGFWIYREFERRGIRCQILHAADIPTTHKGQVNKRDSVDSFKIAQALSHNTGNPIYVPDPETESFRGLLRYRERLLRDIRTCKNRIRSLLLYQGYEVPERFGMQWSNNFIQWLKTFEIEQPYVRTTLNHMINEMELLRGSLLKVNHDVRALQNLEKHRSRMQTLMSVVGVGPLTAITLITEIFDINRFSSFRKLNSFVGLCPMEHSSGDHQYIGNVTVRHNAQLRHLMIEAAWTAIRHDPVMLLVFTDWAKRMGRKKAIIKVARKLLSRIRSVWINNIAYEKGLIG